MSKENQTKKLSNTELEFMTLIWNNQEGITSNDIYSKFDKAQGTMSTILHRIIKKGYVEINRKGKNYVYTPKISRNEYEEMIRNQTIDRLESVISAFFNKKRLTDEQLNKVKSFLEDLKDE